jgi:uncharacterized membrane protein YoaK (UPF0700 family)
MTPIMENETKISLVLSYVAGFVDTAGFIALLSLFTAHVTGNLVLAGAAFSAAGEHGNLAGKLLMLPLFVASVAFTSYLIKYKKATVKKLVLLEALCIAAFAIAGTCLLHQQVSAPGMAIPVTASFAVTGMAIQNTYMRKLLNSYAPNTMMTGNFTQFSIGLFNIADHYLLRRNNKTGEGMEAIMKDFSKVAVVLSGFLVGCFSGALLVRMLGLICCILPALFLLYIRKMLR